MASNSPTLPPGTIPFSLISTLQEEYQKHQVAPFEPGQTTWEKYARRNSLPKSFSPSSRWNDRISLFEGDITKLKTDAIVNAANEALAGGGGVDGAIHAAAGPELSEECRTLNRCPTGQAKITKGYHLPSKHVIHTVGPRVIDPKALMSCYYESLELMRINNLKSIAFPSISTGTYNYPIDMATHAACQAVVSWLNEHEEYARTIDRIIFCVFSLKDLDVYKSLLIEYFPPTSPPE